MMIAPVKSPIKPEKMKPPITPMKITSIGTGASLPSNIGLRILSDKPANKSNMVHIMADVVSLTENI
ncbi:hypothetical protein D3C72_2472180 [compost metagenome]